MDAWRPLGALHSRRPSVVEAYYEELEREALTLSIAHGKRFWWRDHNPRECAVCTEWREMGNTGGSQMLWTMTMTKV